MGEVQIVFPKEKVGVEKTINRARFRKLEDNRWEFYILPEAWRTEVCAGFDAKAIAKALIAKGWLKAGDETHPARGIKIPGMGLTRLYHITSDFLAGESP